MHSPTLLRFFLIAGLLLSTGLVQATPDFPSLTGRVIDEAGLIPDEAQLNLSVQLEDHENQTSNQIVVVTLPTLQGYSINDYANRLGRHWQIGQADKDNGVLLVVAPEEREVRIEVGYGLEGDLTDALSTSIIQREILPSFREGEFATGITKGTAAIIAAIEGEYDYTPPAAKTPVQKYFPLLFIAMIAIGELLQRLGGWPLRDAVFPAAMAGIATTAISDNLVLGVLAAGAIFTALLIFLKSRPPRTDTASGRSPDTEDRNRHRTVGTSSGGFSGGGGSFGGGGASGRW